MITLVSTSGIYTAFKRIQGVALLIFNIFLLVLTVNSQPTFAQTLTIEVKQLEKKLAETSNDKSRLELLFRITENYNLYEAQRGLETAGQAYELAKKLRSENDLLKSINLKANAYIRLNQHRQADSLVNYVLEQSRKQGLKQLEGECLNNLGFVLHSKRRYEDQLQTFEQALQLNKATANVNAQLISLRGIAVAYNNLQQAKRGIEVLDLGIHLAQKVGNKAQESALFQVKGYQLKGMGENQQALASYHTSLLLSQELGMEGTSASSLTNLGQLYMDASEYGKALFYMKSSLAIHEKRKNTSGMANVYGDIGIVYAQLANYPLAMENFLKALELAEKTGNKRTISNNLSHLGIMLHRSGEHEKALTYYKRSLEIDKELGLQSAITADLGNIGNIYLDRHQFDQALTYYQEALQLALSGDNKLQSAAGFNNIGTFYSIRKDYVQAHEHFRQAYLIYEALGNKMGMALILGNFGQIYRDAPAEQLKQLGIDTAQRYQQAEKKWKEALQLAEASSDPDRMRVNYHDLSILYEKQGRFNEAYEAYKKYISYRDSIEGDKVKKQITRKEMQYEFDKKESAYRLEQEEVKHQLQQQELLNIQQSQALQLSEGKLQLARKEQELQHLAYLKEQAEKQEKEQELNLAETRLRLQQAELEALQAQKAKDAVELLVRKNQRNYLLAGLGLTLLLAVAVWLGLHRTRQEKKKSEALLLNILPEEVARELKADGNSEARLYNNVTVLFTDFVNFTGISEQLSPTELVAEIHKNFTAFDAIIEKHGLEKIKTIGDAYLAVCGLPHESDNHAQRVVEAALEICSFIQKSDSPFQIRIGINSGPVVAGIVGVKKYAYDIWGDTVNTAARMEQHSEAGKINISGATYQLVKDSYACTSRGKIQAKNKGEIEMYFVNHTV